MSYPDPSLAFGLPPELQSIVDRELAVGEQVTWSAQPIPARLARAAWPAALVGIPFSAFAVFWVSMAARATWNATGPMPARAFPLFGLPFVGVGAAMLTSPYWARRSAARTAYALTNRRAMIVTRGFTGTVTVRSFEPSTLGDLARSERADGSGDLVFAADARLPSRGGQRLVPVGFIGVRNVRELEERVRALAESRP